MKVLVGCEASQRVCKAFRRKGHEAYSCDMKEAYGDPDLFDKTIESVPEWHIVGDVLDVINDDWDLQIHFPPCTYLSNAGNSYFNVDKYGEKAVLRNHEREKAIAFFMKLVNAPCDKIAIENPVGAMNTLYRKPDQIIHPYYFGEPYLKKTCLWLKGLPVLEYSDTIIDKPVNTGISTGRKTKGKKMNWVDGGKHFGSRQVSRGITFQGIATAMAEQWG